jgi:hypothetical protein
MTDEEVSCARREKPFRSNSTGHGLGTYFLNLCQSVKSVVPYPRFRLAAPFSLAI